MREIKFRAWKKEGTQEMFHKVLSIDWYNNEIKIEYIGYRIDEDKLSDFELMQHTGLKDKNGVEIYEGDIVKYFRNELAVIVYRDGGVDIRSLSWGDCEPLQRRLGEIEVIGNIYEHKYLLREEGFSDE